VDLRRLGWTNEKHWSPLMACYPYALQVQSQAALEVGALAEETLAFLQVRADWFAATASRPPLYHTLLELPETAAELEKRLEVTVEDDWRESDLLRGGVRDSGVSEQNRLLDRHRALHGSYWKSYDFAKGDGKAALAAHPLGPVFKDHPFPGEAFEHDGGEIIFHLPNKLQGYMLVDKQGKRIDKGPLSIVKDNNQWSGSPEIVNGLSCMGCHKNGMKRFEDKVRADVVLNPRGEDREKALELFADAKQLEEAFDADEELFLAAALRAIGPFLHVDTAEELRALEREPIGTLARRYRAELTLPAVVAELGLDLAGAVGEQPALEELRVALRNSPALRPLLNGDRIKREIWGTVDPQLGGKSAMQDLARKLREVLPFDFRPLNKTQPGSAP
jgi:serine/threonine-protein kinase